MQRRYIEWASTFDPALRRAISNPIVKLMMLFIVATGLFLASTIPQTSRFFELEWEIPLLLFCVPFGVGLFGGCIEKRRPLSPVGFGAVALIVSTSLQFFAWSLVAFSARPGNLLMATFPILFAAYHAHTYQASLRFPFQIVATVIAVLAALALVRSDDGFDIWIFTAPITVMVTFVFGSIATHHNQERQKYIAMKEALDAQVLQDRAREAESYREMVLEFRAHGHDAANTLSSALINSEALLRTARATGSVALPEYTQEIAADLCEGLERLGNILRNVRDVESQKSLSGTLVNLDEMIAKVIREVNTRYPWIYFHFDRHNETDSDLVLSVRGGESALHRLLVNLFLNACEGRGSQHAQNVWIGRTKDTKASRCEIVILDDGPGFTDEQLRGESRIFESSKPRGSGLGLYTVERLVAANQGAVSKSNRPEGGARVCILLPILRDH